MQQGLPIGSAPPLASSARFSADHTYRYELRRRWGAGPPFVVIGLNPSTATATENDPTIRRCIAFAKRESCSELIMVNLYALRSTDPKGLRTTAWGTGDPAWWVRKDAVGPENNHAIAAALAESESRGGIVVAAWGGTDARCHRFRVEVVRKLLGALPVRCFGTTRSGHPKHPLYLPADVPLVPWSPK